MKSKIFKLLTSIIIVAIILYAYIGNNRNKVYSFSSEDYKRQIKEFHIPNEMVGHISTVEVAKEQAEKIWIKIYGEKVKKQKPYIVYYDKENDVYMVEGSLPKNMVGGTAAILFQKSDGEVMAVWHTK